LAVVALGATACMDFDGLDGEIELGTHVDDWRDQIIYQVLVDRYADGDYSNNWNVMESGMARWHGGDWAGMAENLDYLADLGVTALWISPVYKNVETDAGVDGYHGYWPQDFTSPNLHFGDIVALRRLVKEAHERDLAIIIDVVTNHVGQLFFYDMNLNGTPEQQVRGGNVYGEVTSFNEYDPDFDPRGIQAFTSLGEAGPAPIIFHHDPVTNHMPPLPEVLQRASSYNRKGRTFNFDDPDQLVHGDFPGGLKDVDTTRCEIKQAMVDVYARWIELSDADGFRIDTVKHVEREFWRYFTQKVRQRLHGQGKRNFFMFGESFDGRQDLVGSFTLNDLPPQEQLDRENQCVTDGLPITGDQLDGVFHFPQYYQVMRDVFQLGQSTDRIQTLWENRPQYYGLNPTQLGTGLRPIQTLVNFIDNHDVARFLFSGAGVEALELALVFLMTQDGIPCIYYGTEQRFAGGNDPANREDLWQTGYDQGAPTYLHVQRLAKLRKGYVALRRGESHVTWATSHTGAETDAGIFAFERRGGDAGDGYALIVLNTHRTKPSSPDFEGDVMQVAATPGTVLVDLLSADRPSFTVAADSTITMQVAPLSALLLVPDYQLVPGL
jgi:glycosidase